MFSDLGISDQKMYFLFKRSLTIVNEGSSLTVGNEGTSFTFVKKNKFLKTIFFENDVFLKDLKRNDCYSNIKTNYKHFLVYNVNLSQKNEFLMVF